jgi:hypothetical protein
MLCSYDSMIFHEYYFAKKCSLGSKSSLFRILYRFTIRAKIRRYAATQTKIRSQ